MKKSRLKISTISILLSVLLTLLTACSANNTTLEPTALPEPTNTVVITESPSFEPTPEPTLEPTTEPTPSPTAVESVYETNNDQQEVTVYVTETGEKYHRNGCKYLKKSKIPMGLDNAKLSGYEPCSICNP